jgi:hypothetical protein
VDGVRYWLRCWQARRIVDLVVVAALAAGALGFVMLAALGARRADTAWDRLRAQTRSEDVLLDTATIAAAENLTTELRDVPGVDRVAAAAYSYIVPKGRVEDFYGGVILALGPGLLEDMLRPVLTTGRLPSPKRADEVVANRSFLEASGRVVGDRVELVDPLGLIDQEVTIVGAGVLPVDFTFGAAAPLAYMTPAFAQRWGRELHELEASGGSDLLTASAVFTGERGVDDDDLAARLVREARPGQVVGVNTVSSSDALVTDTLEFQRNGYIALTVAAAAASLAVLALLLARATRLRSEEVTALRALGFSTRDQRLAVLAPGLFVAAAGSLGATIVAVGLEDLVPTGLADLVGAGLPLADDWVLVALAAIATALALGALAALVASRSTKPARMAGQGREPRLRLLRWPALAVGLRAAFGGNSPNGRSRALAAISAVTIAVLGIGAVAVVLSSRSNLYDDPSLSGHFEDVAISTYSDPAPAREDRARLLASDSITALATLEVVIADIGGVGVEAIVVNVDKGAFGPPVLEGRLPVGDDEVALSSAFLRRQGKDIGDELEVGGPSGARAFRITGTAVFPFAGTRAIGEQLLLTAAGRDALGLEPYETLLVMDVRDADAAHAVRAPNDELEACSTMQLLPLLGVERLPGARTEGIGPCVTRIDQRVANLRELGAVPGVLIGFLAVLGVAGLTYLLGASIRHTGRDLVVLRALGFTRRQALAAVLVHGTSIGLLGALLALPLGIALGRLVWRLTIDDIGLVNRPVVSIAALAGVVVAAALTALLVSALPGARIAFRPAGRQLRVE